MKWQWKGRENGNERGWRRGEKEKEGMGREESASQTKMYHYTTADALV